MAFGVFSAVDQPLDRPPTRLFHDLAFLPQRRCVLVIEMHSEAA
jgi:hypothetical protein